MSSDPDNTYLLPAGFADFLPPDSEKEGQAISALMAFFNHYGYDRVKPPLAEFEETLFASGPGEKLKDNTFRLLDPVSHKMMGVRSDITPQITRIASALLRDKPRPLRLSYANDVLRLKGGDHQRQRQFCQAGAELIGSSDPQADIEICVLAITALFELGIQNVTLDFASPGLVRQVLRHYDLTEPQSEALHRGLDQRAPDIWARADLPEDLRDILEKLKRFKPDTPSDLKPFPAEVQDKLVKLQDIYAGTQRAIASLNLESEVRLTCDLLEMRGFEYHKGVAFTLFNPGAKSELGRGGRYGCGASDEPACGFTLYMHAVREAMPDPEPAKTLSVPQDTDWPTLKALQGEGWRTVRELGDVPEAGKEIWPYRYRNGKVVSSG